MSNPKHHARRRRWSLLAVAALLLGAGWLFLRPKPSARVDATAASLEVTPPRPRPRGALRVTAALPRSHVAPPTAATPPAAPLPRVLQAALDANPHLASYYRLAQKVLPSEDERSKLRRMLSDPGLLQMVKEDLLALHETTYSKDAEAKRMVGVEILSDAVAWEDNPAMSTVMEAIEGVLLAENIFADTPESLAQSLAGDKMDLYTQMLHSSPERAAIVAGKARGKEVEALLSYSKDWYDRSMSAMKADERR